MKVIYILHRYHTNQIDLMKGWRENGHELLLLTQYSGGIEDHADVQPVVVGYAWLFRCFDYLWMNVIRRSDPWSIIMKTKLGFPPLFKLARHIKRFGPDVVIMRERSIYTMCATAICRLYRCPSVLYDLSPVWDKGIKTDLPHRIVHKLTPKQRITPVELRGIDYQGLIQMPGSFFAPFVTVARMSPAEKTYFKDGKINLFSVGKYQERKNHVMMLEALADLSEKYDICLVIAGEVSDKFHAEYLARMEAYVKERGLMEKVVLLSNLDRAKMQREYQSADLHIQPASGEPAGSTITEAMSFSLPVISGSDNGTANYISPGINGEVFMDGDTEDLKRKIETIIKDPDNIPRMGAAAYQTIVDKHSFAGYYRVLEELLV